jgi:nucleoside-diphosphate-sugar epimerase
MPPAKRLTVAVTGPTGTFGFGLMPLLQSDRRVERIVGIARREFDPAEHGWTKTEYRRGDILDRDAVDALVADADVVVHLAYLIMGSREQSRHINLAGTRNVLEATVAAGRPRRLVYTSSVAAYGYHRDNPVPLTEDVPARGTAEHYYSAQKAECEAVLHELTDGSDLEVYVLRPCIVAGPKAPALREKMPWQAATRMLPAALQPVAAGIAGALPLLPDPGVPVQLVHHDDVADAVALCVTGSGEPGAYNIAGDGEVSLREVAAATGTRSVRVPQAAALAVSQALARLPLVPAAAEWLHLGRTSVVMDTTRARTVLGWKPQYSAAETLASL